MTSLFLFASAFVLLAMVAECAARWWLRYRAEYYVFLPGARHIVRPDPRVSPHLEAQVRFDINSDGERGEEVPRSANGLYRVLVAGGSQPEGYLLDQETSWPGALHRLLQRPDHLRRLGVRTVHVGSIARSGAGSEILGRILERVLPRYPRLQAIVILVGVSDVSQWLEYGAPSTPPPSARTADIFKCHPEGPFGWTGRTLALRQLAVRLYTLWRRPIQVQEGAGSWVPKARRMRAEAREIRPRTPDPAPMLDHFERNMRRLLERAQTHADRVLLVRQPWLDVEYTPEVAARMWHGGMGTPWRQQVDTYYSLSAFSDVMRMLDARASAVANELNVEQLDLMPVLERSSSTYYDCFHLTPAGAQRVAAAVAAAILERHASMISRTVPSEPRQAGNARPADSPLPPSIAARGALS
jgi:lysophospholipase L1-like esterase